MLFLLAAAAAAALVGPARAAQRGTVEVVVTLDQPPLARFVAQSRVLNALTKARRLDLRTPTSASYLGSLARAHSALEARIRAEIPAARVRWRYSIVLNGLAVVVPRDRVDDLFRVRAVTRVWPSARYHALLDRSPQLIRADQLWGLPSFSTAGQGMKIGIIDDGVDHTHPFFDPAGFAPPPGFPKGDMQFTTAKVIVARAFAPASPSWKFARRPFDPVNSRHGTHVAGIAAGILTPAAVLGRGSLVGVAPQAYIGNYKVLTVPTEQFGLDGNAPEIAAGIEAAVRDGMDVINLSLGEPEIEPSRDVVVRAIDAAADAGVVPTVAAGNDFGDFGRGSIHSPGSASKAITAAAASKNGIVASFSSSGPTPISLQLKPDVTAPGVAILSSVPAREGRWSQFSGTSMASPHVAGAAALLRQRHPTWTVAQIKSALVLTAGPVYGDIGGAAEAVTTREGGGMIDLLRAADPRIFAEPTSLAFGLLHPGAGAARAVDLSDAGGGAGDWTVTVQPQAAPAGLTLTAPPAVTVPGRLELAATAAPDAPDSEATGFVALQRNGLTRRIPYWLRVARPRLGPPTATLSKPGLYTGDTRGRPARVSSYRYPDDPTGAGVVGALHGPEQVFRVRITRPVANFGVVVRRQAPGSRVYPRIVFAGDENRLTGIPALPVDINPYLPSFGRTQLVAAAIAPAPGLYDIVFDTPSPERAGRFTFRFWIDDRTPPKLRLLTTSTGLTGRLLVAVQDVGSGVDPSSAEAKLDGREADVSFSGSRFVIPIDAQVGPGRHRLELRVSDYQELKNMENVGPILPNTRRLVATFTVRGR